MGLLRKVGCLVSDDNEIMMTLEVGKIIERSWCMLVTAVSWSQSINTVNKCRLSLTRHVPYSSQVTD